MISMFTMMVARIVVLDNVTFHFQKVTTVFCLRGRLIKVLKNQMMAIIYLNERGDI